LSTHLRLGLPSFLFPSGMPTPYPICIPILPHSCYMPRPSHSSWLDYSNYTWRRVQLMKFLILTTLENQNNWENCASETCVTICEGMKLPEDIADGSCIRFVLLNFWTLSRVSCIWKNTAFRKLGLFSSSGEGMRGTYTVESVTKS
jgi:hypothetical protein